MITSKIRKATGMELPDIIRSERREMVPETRMVTRKIVTTQRIVFCRSRVFAAASDFATVKYPFEMNNLIKTAADRINLTA